MKSRMVQVPLFEDADPKFQIRHHPHVVMHGGSPVVDSSLVPVRRIWDFHKRGVPIATLIARYPKLGPSRVLSALAFAYDNAELIAWDAARST